MVLHAEKYFKKTSGLFSYVYLLECNITFNRF